MCSAPCPMTHYQPFMRGLGHDWPAMSCLSHIAQHELRDMQARAACARDVGQLMPLAYEAVRWLEALPGVAPRASQPRRLLLDNASLPHLRHVWETGLENVFARVLDMTDVRPVTPNNTNGLALAASSRHVCGRAQAAVSRQCAERVR